MKKQLLSEELLRMKRLAGIIKEETEIYDDAIRHQEKLDHYSMYPIDAARDMKQNLRKNFIEKLEAAGLEPDETLLQHLMNKHYKEELGKKENTKKEEIRAHFKEYEKVANDMGLNLNINYFNDPDSEWFEIYIQNDDNFLTKEQLKNYKDALDKLGIDSRAVSEDGELKY